MHKKEKFKKKLSHLDVDKGAPLKGKLLIQMFEKSFKNKTKFLSCN